MDEKSEVTRPKIEVPLKLRQKPNRKCSLVSTPSRSSKDELSKDELIARLESEVLRLEKKAKRMHSKLKHVKAKYVASQNDSEAEFEFRINRLLRQATGNQYSSQGSLLPPMSKTPTIKSLGSASYMGSPLTTGMSNSAYYSHPWSLSCERASQPPSHSQSARSLSMPLNEVENLDKIYQAEMVVTNLQNQWEDVNRQKENLESELGLASTELVKKLQTIVEKLPSKANSAHKVLAPPVSSKKNSCQTARNLPESDGKAEKKQQDQPVLEAGKKQPVQSVVGTEWKQPRQLITDIKHGVEAVVNEKQQFLMEVKAKHAENRALSVLLNKFQNENLTLKRKIKRTTDEALLLRLEKELLEQNLEASGEGTFNRVRKNRERANSITSSTDSFSECSLSHLSCTQNERERKAFMEESNKLTQDFALRNELDLLTINSSPSFSANDTAQNHIGSALLPGLNKKGLALEPNASNSKVRQKELSLSRE